MRYVNGLIKASAVCALVWAVSANAELPKARGPQVPVAPAAKVQVDTKTVTPTAASTDRAPSSSYESSGWSVECPDGSLLHSESGEEPVCPGTLEEETLLEAIAENDSPRDDEKPTAEKPKYNQNIMVTSDAAAAEINYTAGGNPPRRGQFGLGGEVKLDTMSQMVGTTNKAKPQKLGTYPEGSKVTFTNTNPTNAVTISVDGGAATLVAPGKSFDVTVNKPGGGMTNVTISAVKP